MITALLLTNGFPFLSGEPFLEQEMKCWAGADVQLVVIPLLAHGISRPLPTLARLDTSMAMRLSRARKLAYAARAMTSGIFWKEMHSILGAGKPLLRSAITALKATALVHQFSTDLKEIVEKHKPDVVYCYWNDLQAYAAAMLKRTHPGLPVVSRAHGFDVYEHRRPDGYMPLKRQFIRTFDQLLTVGESPRRYLIQTYRPDETRVRISRLGVNIPDKACAATPPGVLCIVSVSACIPLKRLDKVIEAIRIASELLPSTQINWVHIGDGPLRAELEDHASRRIPPAMATWKFLGQIPNSQVAEFYESTAVDIFINASESEGLPVSIMEAMSYGVPAIAPDVGAINELVGPRVGLLLSASPRVEEIATGIVNLADDCKSDNLRSAASEKIALEYDGARNYLELIKLLSQIAGTQRHSDQPR
jgi:glycosyltransferase involved in cell wall biosynthesis